jgi:talin
MSESIKRLLAAIREHAPGQADMETAIRRVQQLIAEVDRASMESMQNQRQESTTHVTEQSIQQQIIHTSQALVDRTEPLRRAAVQESENIAHAVREQMAALEPLVHSCISAATMSHDSQQQSVLFDQCKTVTEAELQFLTACKDSAGNPKVS